MKFTVKADISGLERKFSQSQLRAVQAQFARRVGDDSNRYCKWDTGATHNSMVPNSDFPNGRICWSTPYAAEAYVDPRISEHPSTPRQTDPHSHWFEHAKGRHSSEWSELVRKALTS